MSRRRQRARNRAILIGLAIAASLVLMVLALGFYPVAAVGGRVVWASSFRAYVASAVSYQEAARDTYGATSTPLLDVSALGAEPLGAAALDELVEQKIITNGLERLVGDNAAELVATKLDAYRKEPELAGASRAIFQLDPGAFEKAVLAPQAAREVLAGRLFLDGKSLEEWIAAERKSTRVRLFSSSYRWDGEHVRSR